MDKLNPERGSCSLCVKNTPEFMPGQSDLIMCTLTRLDEHFVGQAFSHNHSGKLPEDMESSNESERGCAEGERMN
jgi:hypothetical protein